jgi:hypothetical protein
MLHLGRRLPVAAAVGARPVTDTMDLPGVSAQLNEVPARVFGLDGGFSGQHRIPFGAQDNAIYRDSMS